MYHGKTCAFTGHRPKKFPWRYEESNPECMQLKQVLFHQIDQLVDLGIVHFLSGMAQGVDIWAALHVLTLRKQNPALKLHCILPCKSQAGDWNVSAKQLHHSILEHADSIVYVNREYGKDCMLQRNQFLVSHSDLLLAVYNGEPHGGTTATVRYAKKQNLDILILHPLTQKITYEKEGVKDLSICDLIKLS